MSNLVKVCLFSAMALALCFGGYFILERDEWGWITAKKQINQFVDFSYEGADNEKPKIGLLELQTKFIEKDEDSDLRVGFILSASFEEQEIKTTKTSFPEFILNGRAAGYSDDEILDKVIVLNEDFKSKTSLCRAYEYSSKQVTDYVLRRWGSVLKVIGEIVGYRVDLNIALLDKDGFCLQTVCYQAERKGVFDHSDEEQDPTYFSDVIFPGKGANVIQKTIETPISRQLAKKVKSVVFWPTLSAETKLVDIGLDEEEMKKQEEEYRKEHTTEDSYEEDSIKSE